MMSTRKPGETSPDADQADVADLSAEEAEALAAAAEAEAAAARARANVLRVQQAKATRAAEATDEVAADDPVKVDADNDVAAEDADDGAVEDIDAIEDIDAADGVDDAEDDSDPVRRGGKLTSIVKYAAVILAVLGIAALASTSAWIVVKHQQAEQRRDLSAQFSAAARQGVVSLMSLDFNRAQQDVQRIIDNSTGQFREDFQSQAEEFAKVAESSKVVTEANVTATAVQTMTDDTADVLVAAASTITNAQGAKEDPRSWRLIVSVARDGDQIKMAKVEFAP
jgi:Mce-associated membrane protein